MNKDKIIVASIGFVIGTVVASGVFLVGNSLSDQKKSLTSPIPQEQTSSANQKDTSELSITSPDDLAQTTSDETEVKGKANKKATIVIFTNLESQVAVPDENGLFSSKVKLDPGANEITITSYEEKGEYSILTRFITYLPEDL